MWEVTSSTIIIIIIIHGLMIKLSRPKAELQFDLQLLHKITKIAMKLFIYTSRVKNSQKYRYKHVDPIKMYDARCLAESNIGFTH